MKFFLVFAVAVSALTFGQAALADGNTAALRGYVKDLHCPERINLVRPGVSADVYDMF